MIRTKTQYEAPRKRGKTTCRGSSPSSPAIADAKRNFEPRLHRVRRELYRYLVRRHKKATSIRNRACSNGPFIRTANSPSPAAHPPALPRANHVRPSSRQHDAAHARPLPARRPPCSWQCPPGCASWRPNASSTRPRAAKSWKICFPCTPSLSGFGKPSPTTQHCCATAGSGRPTRPETHRHERRLAQCLRRRYEYLLLLGARGLIRLF